MDIIFGILPESLFFTLFMTFSKKLKNKRVLLFILLTINALFGKWLIYKNIFFYVVYFCISFLVIKLLYKENSDIIDFFTFSIASFIVIITELIAYILYYLGYNLYNMNYMLFYLLEKIFLFGFVILSRKIIRKKYLELRKYWNRAIDKRKRKKKSISVRLTSLMSLSILICLINIGLLYIIN